MGCKYIGTDFNWHEGMKVIHDPPSRIPRVKFDGAKEPLDKLIEGIKEVTEINHPQYYNKGKIEVIDFIEDQQLGFGLGSSVKYICRAGKKDPDKYTEDLKKAVWYLNREIERVSR